MLPLKQGIERKSAFCEYTYCVDLTWSSLILICAMVKWQAWHEIQFHKVTKETFSSCDGKFGHGFTYRVR